VTQPLHDEDEPALDQRELVDGTGDNYGWPTFTQGTAAIPAHLARGHGQEPLEQLHEGAPQ
jgi:hypothetical protein